MPPTPPAQARYASIGDFSPGIVNRSNQSLGNVSVPAKLGAAQLTNTYRCIALPGGGLGPLPRRIETFSLPAAPEGVAPSSAGFYYIVGFHAHGPMSVAIGGLSQYIDQLFLAVAYTPNASTQQRFRLYRHRIFEAVAPPYGVDTLKSINSGYTGIPFYETAWFTQSRMNRGTPTNPGNPLVAASWATAGGANEKFISTFPDTNAPAVTGMFDLSTARWGQLYGHQGRLVLNEVVVYSLGAVGGSFTEEQMSFTDPNAGVLGTQNEIFSQEFPSGIGAFGSISAGELILIKRRGGAVLLSGDIANPDQVVRLPGVQSTGGAVTNRTASSPIGLLYAVKNGGIWAWRGSDTSQKVSSQLQDNAFEVATPPRNTADQAFQQPVVSIEDWGEWVVATGNWLLNTHDGSWWQLDNSSEAGCQYWARSWGGQYLYGARYSFTQSDLSYAFAWDRSKAASSYSWQSHPIPESTERIVEIREIVLLAQGTGTVKITLTGIDPSGQPATVAETFTITNRNQPQRLRKSTACIAYNVIVRIESDSGNANQGAPIVYPPLALQIVERQRAVAV